MKSELMIQKEIDSNIFARIALDSALKKLNKHYKNFKKEFSKNIDNIKKSYPSEIKLILSFENKIRDKVFHEVEGKEVSLNTLLFKSEDKKEHG